MKTKHSIDLTKDKSRCFAAVSGSSGCTILPVQLPECGTSGCRFYKPGSCRDWVRIEDEDGINLIPPEEYYTDERCNQEPRSSKRT